MNDAPNHLTWNDALFAALRAEFAANESVCLFAAAGVPSRSQAVELQEEFGDSRVRMAPVTSESLVGMGAGAARAGMRAIVELPSDCPLTQSLGHLADHICSAQFFSAGRVSMPLLVRAVVHDNDVVDMLSVASLPAVHTVIPSSTADAVGLTRSALRADCAVILLEPESLIDESHSHVGPSDALCPLETAGVLRRGQHATVIAAGHSVALAARVLEDLHAEGIETDLIDVRSLSPLDMKTILQSVSKTGRVLIADSVGGTGGWGAELASRIGSAAFDELDAPPVRCSGIDLATGRPLSPASLGEAIRKLVATARAL